MTAGAPEPPNKPPLNYRVVAIVVTHNRLEQLQATLRTLLNVSPAHLAAVVVYDNASTDGTRDWLAQHPDDRLTVLSGPENIGGAGGFEQAMRWAAKTLDPDWMLLLDDDARPMPDCLAQFTRQSRQRSHAWAAAVFNPDGSICEMNRPTRNPFWSFPLFLKTLIRGTSAFHLTDGDYSASEPTGIDIASFVGLFLSRATWKRCGYPDGRLFLYGDDVIYCLTLRRQGLTITFDPALRFRHDDQTSSGAVSGPLWKPYYAHRNLLLAYKKAAGMWFLPVLIIKIVTWTLALRSCPKPQRAIKRRLLFTAIRDGLAGDLSRSHDDIARLASRQ